MHKSSSQLQHELYFAIYMLRTRFDTPKDLLIYWSFAGPCREPHPDIEDIHRSA